MIGSTITNASFCNSDPLEGQNFAVFKLNYSFQLDWCYVAGGDGIDVFTKILALNDSTYVISGNSRSLNFNHCSLDTDFTYTNGYLLCLNWTGQLQWSKGFCSSEGVFFYGCIADSATGAIYINAEGVSTDGDLSGTTNYGEDDILLIKLELVTGINDVHEPGQIKYYPIPASDYIRVILEDNKEYINSSYAIRNVLGQVVIQGILSKVDNDIYTGILPVGIFYLEISNESYPKIFKKCIKK